jgi:hypothetical protein
MDGAPIPPELEVALPDQGEILRPDLAVRERDPQDGTPSWQLLIRLLDIGEAFDAVAHSQMERLLRETGTPAGLLFNGRALRLISAPKRGSPGVVGPWQDVAPEALRGPFAIHLGGCGVCCLRCSEAWLEQTCNTCNRPGRRRQWSCQRGR